MERLDMILAFGLMLSDLMITLTLTNAGKTPCV